MHWIFTPTGKFNLNWINIIQNGTNTIKTTKECNNIYPNPAIDKLHITREESIKSSVVSIIDQLGKIRLSASFAEGTKNMEMDVSRLESGVYIVQIKNDSTTSSSIIVKQ